MRKHPEIFLVIIKTQPSLCKQWINSYYQLNITKLLKNAKHSVLLRRQKPTVQALPGLAKQKPSVVCGFSPYFEKKKKVKNLTWAQHIKAMERASKKTDDTTTSTDRWGPRRCRNKDTEWGVRAGGRAVPSRLTTNRMVNESSSAVRSVRQQRSKVRVPRDLVTPSVITKPWIRTHL